MHAATQVGSGSTAYTATYDAAGNMTCRAPDGTSTCTGSSPTGQPLTWDTDGRLAAWQNTPSSPTSTASYLYDGEGARVAQVATNGGGTTTTTYVGNLEEVSTTGSTTTTTDYLYAAGKLLAESVTSGGATTLSYLVSNAQGTPLESLDTAGNVTASRLYSPYGGMRYRSGSFATRLGYTGQRNDTNTNLDYYGARYYDPVLGQFTSADTVMDGLNRYGYVGGNPETATDPSGQRAVDTLDPAVGEPGAVPDTGDGAGGGGIPLPEINPQPVIQGVGQFVGNVVKFVGGVVGAAAHLIAIPTAESPGVYSSDDGTPIAHGHNQPARAPSTPSKPSGPGTGGNGGGNPPKTQPGGGGAGAPPSGGGGPPSVVSPPPADDNCGCEDQPVDPTVYLHHGTSLENARSIIQHGIDASRLNSGGAFFATGSVDAAQGFAASTAGIGNPQGILVYALAQSLLNTLLGGGLAREQLMNFPYGDDTEFVFEQGAFDTLNASLYGVYEPGDDGMLKFRLC